MSNRPKTKSKIQYGDDKGVAKPAPTGKISVGGASGIWLAVGIGAGIVVLALIAFFAANDGGGDTGNNVAFQSATVTGASLATMPSDAGAVPADDPAKGQTIPTVVGKTFDGSKVEIKPGEAQLIAIIAHWCPHCQKEVPLIVGWQKDGSLPKGVKITAVSTAAAEAKGNFPPASWLEKEEWKNPVLVDTATSKVLNAFGATGFPTLIAVTADGKVAQRASGELSLDQVKGLFDAALGKGSAPTDTGTDNTPITSPVPTTTAAP